MSLEGGFWPKFSRYEISGGYIRPAPDATISRYQLRRDPNTKEERPYIGLARAIGAHGSLSGSEHVILEWCRRFGLLGVLLQRVETVVFPPTPAIDLRTFRAQRASGKASDVTKKSSRSNVVTLQRTAQGWQQTSADMDARSVPPVGVVIHGVADTHVRLEPLTETWSKFFPSIPTQDASPLRYPHPVSEEFWRTYEEPLETFIQAARHLTDALDSIARTKAPEGSHWTIREPRNERAPLEIGVSGTDLKFARTRRDAKRTDFAPLSDYHLAILELSGCTNAIRLYPDVNPESGHVSLQWRAPTLMSSLALMVLQDLGAGRTPQYCENPRCDNPLFTTSAYQSRYCSPKCKWYVNKAMQRRGISKRRRRTKRISSAR